MTTPLVLVVDDDPDVRATVRDVLVDEGYTVEVGANGLEALERVRRSPPPALVLLDLMMPLMDGVTLLRELESHADLASIPIVVLTALTATESTSGLRYPLLRKPFELDALLDMVTKYCPRLWDDEEPLTDECAIVDEDDDARDTRRELCVLCRTNASTRCAACGRAFCRGCLDAGPSGRCAECWRASPAREG